MRTDLDKDSIYCHVRKQLADDFAGPPTERIIDRDAPAMDHHQMHFLDVRCLAAWYAKKVVNIATNQPCFTGESNGHHSMSSRGRQSSHDILRLTAGREADCDIAFPRKRLDLSLEHCGIPEIIPDTSRRSAITG